jgi:Mn2+/Fe2+ NRAMP family transporter
VAIAAGLTIIGASTGNFRRFERFALALCFGSLLLVPILLMSHPPMGQTLHDLVIPGLPKGKLSDVMLLIIGLVGTTIAPWQLFFQQSYVVDKRITPRFIAYERADLWLGIVLVMVGGIALMAFAAAAFTGTPEFGNFTDVGGVAEGLARHVGPTAGVLFALALIDASVIGASAVSLSTAYAIGDVLAVKHSLHRKPRDAVGFYMVYAGLIGLAATLVVIPGSPLGLLTLAVQVLAGVLLPSATVFLLLLCNDRAVLGPWVNKPGLNVFTGAVIAVLVVLSVILTAAVLYPDISDRTILWTLAGGMLCALVVGGLAFLLRRNRRDDRVADRNEDRNTWRMPPLAELAPARLTLAKRLWLGVLRFYLLAATIMVVVRVAQLALARG